MSNRTITVYDSKARTTDPTVVDLSNATGRGLHLVIDVTAVDATPSVTFTINGKDPVSGKVWTILASAAITATGTTILKVYPGLMAAANAAANDVLPPTWQVTAVHGDADSITYVVTAQMVD